MNTVFFDIECASVYKTTAKICAFGYVICDEEFNIIKKEDILVNPKGKFHLTDGRGEHGLELPYDYAEFKKYPPFPEVYKQIKSLLEDKDNRVYGHSTLNDVKYLDLETNRFHLPPFNFAFADSQLLYMTAVGDYSRQFGLEYITRDLNVEFTPHRAADDAYATMKIVEAMCRRYGVTLSELEDKFKIRYGKINNHRITRPNSKGFEDYCRRREKEKRERGQRRTQFYIFLSRRKFKKGGKLNGKSFNFSRSLEDKTEISMDLVAAIYENGGRYTQKLADCDVYVCEDGDDTVRTRNARQTEGLPIINTEGLKAILND
ncbi:MAG: exonuclease domain-containing protein [Candidatus Coproplasma sp.]